MYDRPYPRSEVNFNKLPVSILKYGPDKKDRGAKYGSKHHPKELKYPRSQRLQPLIHASNAAPYAIEHATKTTAENTEQRMWPNRPLAVTVSKVFQSPLTPNIILFNSSEKL
jgi:hypothetical protein